MNRKQSHYTPHGSLLVFAVAVLAVLALVGGAFLVVVTQAMAASKPGVNAGQADQAAYSGQQHVKGALNTQTRFQTTSVYDPLRQEYLGISLADTNPVLSTNLFTDPNVFSIDARTPQGPWPLYALLSEDSRFPLAPHYSVDPMRIASNGGTPTGALPDPIWARGHYVTTSMDEFFPAASLTGDKTRKTSLATGIVRGRHFVWRRDLDSNFYINVQDWGVNDQALHSVPGETRVANDITGGILTYMQLPTTTATEMNSQDSFGPQEISTLLNTSAAYFPKSKQFTSMGDVVDLFAISNPNDPRFAKSFLDFRSDLDTYFSVTPDTLRDSATGQILLDSNNEWISQYKPHPAAININTAPLETIQALLSQIPYNDTPGAPFETFAAHPSGNNGQKTAEDLAQRIVAKRPFYSRIDFEDFMAAQLIGDVTNSLSPRQMIYLALQNYKRAAVPISPPFPANVPSELSLAEWMEIPSLQPNDPVYANLNTCDSMFHRFQYFMSTGANGTLPGILTVKAFNNALNSLLSVPGPSFNAQYGPGIVVGQPVPNGTPVIICKSLSVAGIRLGGDDTLFLTQDQFGNQIYQVLAGPNGIAESIIAGGYSYYSHDDAAQDYKPIFVMPAKPASYDPLNPRSVGKFVYSNSTKDVRPVQGVHVDDIKNYEYGDLVRWSCIGTGTTYGYYDMWFNPYDEMHYDLGEVDSKPQPQPTEVGIKLAPGAPSGALLLSGSETVVDDIQEHPIGTAVQPGQVLVTPGPNHAIDTTDSVTQLPARDGQKNDDIVVDAILLGDPMSFDPATGTKTSANYDFRDKVFDSKDGISAYIVPAYNQPLYSKIADPDPTKAPDLNVKVIVDGGNMICNTSTADDERNADIEIQLGKNSTLDTYVWGPMRASQRNIDQEQERLYISNPAPMPMGLQVPTARFTSGINGHVAWSPPICFRSRFYGTYVLAQGLSSTARVYGTVKPNSANAPTFTAGVDPHNPTAGPGSMAGLAPGYLLAITSPPSLPSGTNPGNANPLVNVYVIDSVNSTVTPPTFTIATPLQVPISNSGDPAVIYSTTVIGERRTESIYDAVNDKVLWSRSPTSDER